MKDFTKNIIRSAATLGIIAGVAALLIGLTNMVTADTIAANANAAENKGLAQVFDEVDGVENTYSEIEDLDTSSFNFVEKIWICYGGSDSSQLGYIYRTSGSNAYGSVTMLLGISGLGDLGNMVILENTETYNTTLQANYIDVYNASDDKNNAIYDTSCGATYGANLIKNMASEALDDYVVRSGASTGEENEALDVIFPPADGTTNTYVELTDVSGTYIKEIYICYNDGVEQGYVYRTSGNVEYFGGLIDMYIGISGEGELGTISIIKDTTDLTSQLNGYISDYNNSDDKETAVADVSCGATYSATLVYNMASEALDDYVARKNQYAALDVIFPPEDGTSNSYEQLTDVSGTYIKEIYICSNSGVEQGYIYRTTGTVSFGGTIDLYVGISGEGELGTISLIEDTTDVNSQVKKYINNYNSSDDKSSALDDYSVASGGTVSVTLINTMVSEALDDYVGRIA